MAAGLCSHNTDVDLTPQAAVISATFVLRPQSFSELPSHLPRVVRSRETVKQCPTALSSGSYRGGREGGGKEEPILGRKKDDPVSGGRRHSSSSM